MAYIKSDVSVFGPGRTIAATTTSKRNATALSPGRYVFRVDGDGCHIQQGSSSVTATTNDMLLLDNDLFVVVVPEDAAFAYIAIRANATTATVYAVGADLETATAQPPAWA